MLISLLKILLKVPWFENKTDTQMNKIHNSGVMAWILFFVERAETVGNIQRWFKGIDLLWFTRFYWPRTFSEESDSSSFFNPVKTQPHI